MLHAENRGLVFDGLMSSCGNLGHRWLKSSKKGLVVIIDQCISRHIAAL